MIQRLVCCLAAAAVAVFAADSTHGLAPTGTLRAVFLGGNPVQGRVDQSGAISGPVAEIVAELARRLGVTYRITPAANPRAVLDSVKDHTADIGFLAFDATRAAEVDFSQPYELAYNSYLVRGDSPLRTVADVDREGVRIAAPKGDSGDLFLTRSLKHAQLRSIAGLTVDDARKMLAASEIDAFAANRQRLTEAAARFPELRVVTDNFYGVEQSLVIAKGDPQRIEFLNRFLDEVRASGLLQGAIDRARLSGVEVAPRR